MSASYLSMSTKLLSSVLVFVAGFAEAQTSALVAGGYRLPADFNVAPGQVLTLFATGIGKRLSDQPTRASAPFPTTLAGLSVTVTPGNGGAPLAAPILAAVMTDTCR